MSTTTDKGTVHSWGAGFSGWDTDMDTNLKIIDAWSARAWSNKVSTTSGLTYGYHGGPLLNAGAFALISDGTVALSDNSNNYVERTLAGVVSKNTSGFTVGQVPMAKVTTLSGAITVLEDWRTGAADVAAVLRALAVLSAANNKIPRFTGASAADLLDFSIDGTLAGNSDTTLVSEKAIKTAIANAVSGLSWKQSVRAATTGAGTLASSFENSDTIDGVTLATGDRILIKDQASGAENGIYTVNASGAPTRAADADTAAEIRQASVYVEEGTTNADTQWTCSTNAPITLNTTALTFTQFTSGGSAALDDLTDVDAASPADGDVLTFNNGTGNWENAAPSGGSVPAWVTDHPDNPPGSANVVDDEWGGSDYPSETALDTGGTRFASAVAWSWVNQGTGTATLSGGHILLKAPAVSGQNIRMVLQSVPSGNWRIHANVRKLAIGNNADFAGMCLRESSTSKITSHVHWLTSNQSVLNHTNETTGLSGVYNLGSIIEFAEYLGIEYDGTNYKFWASYDNVAWQLLSSVAKASFFSTAADQIGLCASSNHSTIDCTLISRWWRRVA